MNMNSELEIVTPGEVLGSVSEIKAGMGAYVSSLNNNLVYASLTGLRSLTPPSPQSPDQRPTVEVIGHKAHGAVPEPGVVVLARVTKVMAKMASADIMCVGTKAVREKFTGIIRQQDVRATEIDKVDMHASFRPGDIVKALVVSFMLNYLLGMLGRITCLLQKMSLVLYQQRVQQAQQWFQLVGRRCNAPLQVKLSRERLRKLEVDYYEDRKNI